MKSVHQIKPSTFAESVFSLDGAPFRLTNRKYLLPIYDADIENGLVMSGRQVEKSTTNATKMGSHTLLQKNFRGLYVAPINEQVKEFSKARLGKFYSQSQGDIVNRIYRDKKNDTDNVYFKDFSGSNSVNYFRHCYDNGDNIRGITVNGIWIDEIQDINVDAIPVIKEAQSHALEAGSKTRVTWYTGTPKTFSNTIQQYWERSTQNEWVVKCPHCNVHQILGVKNLEPKRFKCRKCGSTLTNADFISGIWIPMVSSKKISGYRISQLMVPWISPADIWDKYESYPIAQFYNEVLGRSYENADKPFDIVTLRSICNNEYSLLPRIQGEATNRPIFMGVDWGTGGKSYTVAEIYALLPNDTMHLIYAKRFQFGEELEEDKQLDMIAGLISAFNVNTCIVDWGFGYTQSQKLQKKFGSRVAPCYYSSAQKDERKWDAKESRWIVNRTQVIQKYINSIKEHRTSWPGKSLEELSWLFDHHLVETAEYRKSYNGRSEDLMFSHPESQPDDGLHAGVYAHLACDIYKSKQDGDFTFSGVYM